MSVVIVGGNDSMTRQYKDICKAYQCRAKVFTQMHDGLKHKIGSPDLLVLFTGTVSHKMLKIALNATSKDTRVIRSHTSSATALRNILQEHTAGFH
ncbi:MAG: DUF2325 domain-containing protein [Oscillospiraceae bacterium]|nr:DUF2325 domain-containing protein [Ruminococcus sp.]MDE6706897.1 DUF2325 domain-containing protein [Oscillospiraceae bacterium]